MTITEKAAYLRGLVEGQGLDPEAGEGKLWHVLSELVGDLATEVQNLRTEHEDLADSLEEVQVGMDYLEELVQEDYDDFGDDLDDYDEDDGDDDYYPFGQGKFRIVDDEGDELTDEEEADDDDDGIYYEVECPNCGEQISFDDETLEEGSITCPSCGASLAFDLQAPDEDGDADDEELPEDGADRD